MPEHFERITGTEVEYGFLGRSMLPDDQSAPLRHLLDYLPECLARSGQYLSNGGRAYIDTGHHPEYATPECLDVADTVESEIAGELIIAEAIGSLAAHGLISKKYRIHKRVLDANRVACGAHQNYATTLEINPDNDYIRDALAAHFISSAVFFGAGHFDGEDWHVSQKFGVLNLVSYATSHTDGHRPIVDTRGEPHADSSRFRRLHVTSSDANISPWAMRIKLASTSMFVRLLENKVNVQDLFLKDPVDAARLVADDPTLTTPLLMESGKTMTALQIQAEIIERVRNLSKSIEFSQADLDDLDEWEQACTDATFDPQLLEDRADWVQKMSISPMLAERKGGKNIPMNIRAFDQLYDLIGPKFGIGIQLRNKGVFRCTPKPKHVWEALQYPPSNTRAWLRGTMILRCAGRKVIKNASWEQIALEPRGTYSWDNPYEHIDTRVDDFLTALEAVDKTA